MEKKIRLADAMNTYNSALLVLQTHGYKVWLEPSEDDSELGTWWASKDEADFAAFDPLRLLGLIAMWEQRGNQWQRKANEENLYDKLLTQALGDE
ncbi:hypothetical protein PN36_27660 [Candidatus Thiomargarita nelsonii]|uniref:Uncharacterized protein n=1 Tax=Candidatus Thiomargarita nelsonii TaxID=1003181 RepID=A0A4E0QY59_9GAMM|nr:hypothetical protein PN36_27645 [Candidatus Thiomargarita nelsonii]TGO02274.1 hypothetical protein PN36_27660 [Candidatus Thiomargarita nelsonii]